MDAKQLHAISMACTVAASVIGIIGGLASQAEQTKLIAEKVEDQLNSDKVQA